MNEALGNLEAQRVLGFQVDSNVTIGQALASDEGIGAAKDVLLKAVQGKATAAAAGLCSLVAAKAHALGFNRYDTTAIVWAYVSLSFEAAPDAFDVIRNASHCAPLKHATKYGLPMT